MNRIIAFLLLLQITLIKIQISFCMLPYLHVSFLIGSISPEPWEERSNGFPLIPSLFGGTFRKSAELQSVTWIALVDHPVKSLI